MDLKDIFKKNRKVTPEKKREFYSLTLIIVPTVLMAMVSMFIDNFLERAVAQIIILFFQAVVLKGIIENK